jgi:hypothetical protein
MGKIMPFDIGSTEKMVLGCSDGFGITVCQKVAEFQVSSGSGHEESKYCRARIHGNFHLDCQIILA